MLLCGSCNRREFAGADFDLKKAVQNNRSGVGADQWIEMKNMSGDWEKTGLIFGYVDDYEECLKAIDGLQRANFARRYRCVPAN